METYRVEETPWGTKRTIWESTELRVDHLEIIEGGFSSKHVHIFQYNKFYLLKGQFILYLFEPDDKLLLFAQPADNELDILIIPPKRVHQFEAKTKVECLEFIYFKPGDFDIERFSKNGVKTPS